MLADVRVVGLPPCAGRFRWRGSSQGCSMASPSIHQPVFIHGGLRGPRQNAHQGLSGDRQSGRTRVATDGRSPAQLVVDAADSWRSVPMMCMQTSAAPHRGAPAIRLSAGNAAPPVGLIHSSSRGGPPGDAAARSTMSVPRPAILVAMVMAPASGLGHDDLAFAVLRVQHDVAQFSRLSSWRAARSFQSTRCPPGWAVPFSEVP